MSLAQVVDELIESAAGYTYMDDEGDATRLDLIWEDADGRHHWFTSSNWRVRYGNGGYISIEQMMARNRRTFPDIYADI